MPSLPSPFPSDAALCLPPCPLCLPPSNLTRLLGFPAFPLALLSSNKPPSPPFPFPPLRLPQPTEVGPSVHLSSKGGCNLRLRCAELQQPCLPRADRRVNGVQIGEHEPRAASVVLGSLFLPLELPRPSSSGAPTRVTSLPPPQEWDEARTRQDSVLDEISNGLAQLKNMGQAMQEELDRQDPLLDGIEEKVLPPPPPPPLLRAALPSSCTNLLFSGASLMETGLWEEGLLLLSPLIATVNVAYIRIITRGCGRLLNVRTPKADPQDAPLSASLNQPSQTKCLCRWTA